MGIITTILISFIVQAAEVCNVCLDTPSPTKELSTGKGGSTNGKGDVEELSAPLFTGEIYYSLDGEAKILLPQGKGVFFSIPDRKKHKLQILSVSGINWGKVTFDCAEYDNGSRISFSSYGFYSPGWKTAPLPKDPKRCPWHPEHTHQ